MCSWRAWQPYNASHFDAHALAHYRGWLEKLRAAAIEPMVALANSWDADKHAPAGYLMSEKLDGMRAVWDGAALRPDWSRPVGLELYDHSGDDGMAPAAFDDFENENLADRPEWAAVQVALLEQLRKEVQKWQTPNPSEARHSQGLVESPVRVE